MSDYTFVLTDDDKHAILFDSVDFYIEDNIHGNHFLKNTHMKNLLNKSTCHKVDKDKFKVDIRCTSNQNNDYDNEYDAYRKCIEHHYDYYIENFKVISHKENKFLDYCRKAVVKISFKNSNVAYVTAIHTNLRYKTSIANEVYRKKLTNNPTIRKHYKDIEFPPTIYNMDFEVFIGESIFDLIDIYTEDGYDVVAGNPMKFVEKYRDEINKLNNCHKEVVEMANFYNIYVNKEDKYVFIFPCNNKFQNLNTPSLQENYGDKFKVLGGENYPLSKLKKLYLVGDDILNDNYLVYRYIIEELSEYTILNNKVAIERGAPLAEERPLTIVITCRGKNKEKIYFVDDFMSSRKSKLSAAADYLVKQYKNSAISSYEQLRVYDLDISVVEEDIVQVSEYIKNNLGTVVYTFNNAFYKGFVKDRSAKQLKEEVVEEVKEETTMACDSNYNNELQKYLLEEISIKFETFKNKYGKECALNLALDLVNESR